MRPFMSDSERPKMKVSDEKIPRHHLSQTFFEGALIRPDHRPRPSAAARLHVDFVSPIR